MKPQELFYGALCLYGKKEITIIDSYEIVLRLNSPLYFDINYHPIPLTPAVVGCIENNSYRSINDSNPHITYSDKLNRIYINISGTRKRLSHIKQLHQLQHLYFALTGEEMKVDLEKLKTVI